MHSFVGCCLDSSERSKENRGKHDERSLGGQEACHEGTSPRPMQNTQSVSYINFDRYSRRFCKKNKNLVLLELKYIYSRKI